MDGVALEYMAQVVLWLVAGTAAGLGLGEGINRLRTRRIEAKDRR